MFTTDKILAAGCTIWIALGSVLLVNAEDPGKGASRKKSKFADRSRIAPLAEQMAKLRPLAKKFARPKPGEWAYHHKEPGQTFEQYVSSGPPVPTEKRKRIYLQPLGRFTDKQRQIVDLAAEFLRIYFGLEVKVRNTLPLSLVPGGARRIHPELGNMQINTEHILKEILLPRVPSDACAVIALTTVDLYPSEEWNFVFGSASLQHRVGVWSLYRHGDPEGGKRQYALVVLRTFKTAAHEIGHMLSILHCRAFECNMCGSNSSAERDARPIALCPECLGKLCWATGSDPGERYRNLGRFYRAHGLGGQSEFCDKSLRALGFKPSTRPATTRAVR
jgi:archaemetzincin